MCLQPGSVCLISAEPELGLELPEDGLICFWLDLGEHWCVYGCGVGINGLAVGLDPSQAWIWVSPQTWTLPKESGFICSGTKGAAFRWLNPAQQVLQRPRGGFSETPERLSDENTHSLLSDGAPTERSASREEARERLH